MLKLSVILWTLMQAPDATDMGVMIYAESTGLSFGSHEECMMHAKQLDRLSEEPMYWFCLPS